MSSRPRDRRAQIITAAAQQFHHVGYHRVSTADIAAAVGITAGALYRHFRSKQELLAEIILDRLERLENAFGSNEDGPLEDIVRALTTYGLDYRDLGVLWQRESKHLPGPERDKLRHRGRELALRFAQRIRRERPELTPVQAETLAWAVFAVVASPSHTTVERPRPHFDNLLASTALSALAAPVPAPAAVAGPSSAAGTLLRNRSSRRELLLDAAVELFARDGFTQVTMEDIGAGVGIAGPSIYNHFSGKAEILDAAVTRGSQWLQFLITGVLASATSAQEASDALLHVYTTFAVPQSALIEVLLSETPYLADDSRHATRRAQREFVTEWVELLRHDRPDLDADDLRVVVLAELTILNNIARTQHLITEPGVHEHLISICTAIQHDVLNR